MAPAVHRSSMRLVSLLAVLASVWIAIWTLEILASLPGALTVSSGAMPTLGVLALVVLVIVGGGMVSARSLRTTYW